VFETALPPPTLVDDRPGEACGVFGIFAPDHDTARLTYFGLFALQHRGQESAGIAAADGETVTVYKDLGLVAQVFDETTLSGLTGDVAIGHTRYSTTGSSAWENSQPIYRQANGTGIALAHNGNLSNTHELAARLTYPGTSDSDIMTEMIAREVQTGRTLVDAVGTVAPSFVGAFSLTILDTNTLVGIRDPFGFRPLVLGRLNNGWVIASETCALDIVGAEFVREIEPGEMVAISDTGIESHFPFPQQQRRQLCVFEFVYFSRPDSIMRGKNVHGARRRMGLSLADQAPVDVDIVVPVPESGIPAAQGYAAATGLPYTDGLVKNRYVGRTFIQPAQSMRDRGVRLKLNAMPGELKGQRVVLVDDSIVRGSTTKQLVAMVREAGATEVHLRISSPPYRWPCFYGMDTGDRNTLLAAGKSVDEIAAFLDVDSLAYLELDRLLDATGLPANDFCTACLSGEYATDIPTTTNKLALESTP
jgi:amidophosphoribosyltransferase